MKSADLSRKISEASSENQRKSPKVSPKILEEKFAPQPSAEPLLIISPSSRLSQSAPRINIESPNQLNTATVDDSSINLRVHQPSPRANEEIWESQRKAKARNIRAILDLLTFDKEFHKLSTDCTTALDECEKVLQVNSPVLKKI